MRVDEYERCQRGQKGEKPEAEKQKNGSERQNSEKKRSEFSKPNFKLGHYLQNRCSTIFVPPPFIICSLRPRFFGIKENRKVKGEECQA